MKELLELHCKDGTDTVDIKNVNKTLPSYRVRIIARLILYVLADFTNY